MGLLSGLKFYAVIGAVAALLAAFGATYLVGRSAGSAACEARWTARESRRIAIEQTLIDKRDAAVNAAKADEARRASDRAALIDKLQDQVDAYENKLADDPGCVISDDDARSLSDIK